MTNRLNTLPGQLCTCTAPTGGWKPDTIYLVEVSHRPTNPIHGAILHTGFINDDGTFGNYCEVWSNNYDASVYADKLHYLAFVKELGAFDV